MKSYDDYNGSRLCIKSDVVSLRLPELSFFLSLFFFGRPLIGQANQRYRASYKLPLEVAPKTIGRFMRAGPSIETLAGARRTIFHRANGARKLHQVEIRIKPARILSRARYTQVR